MWSPLLLASLLATVGRAEIFTALVDMENLAYTERELIGLLDKVIQAEERKIQTLRKYMDNYQRVNAELAENTEAHLHNPVNAYLVVKRLTLDWRKVESVITENVGAQFVQNITLSEDLRIPDDEDLTGAAMALIRLQDTYRLDTGDIARGEIAGSTLKRLLTAGDCFELGRQTYNNGDFRHTVSWMEQAWSLWREETERTAPLGDILEYLAFSIYKMGDIHKALRLTNQLLEQEPGHPRGVGNKAYYEQELSKAQSVDRRRKGETGDLEDAPKQQLQQNIAEGLTVSEAEAKLPERDTYEAMCRGEITLSPAKSRRLRCYYAHNDAPFLLLQPIQAEELYLRPRLVMYHRVMYETEMAAVKALAQPRLARATVQNSRTGQLETASYRISKSAWLKSGEHQLVDQVNRRVAQLTGLNLDTAEELQVVNYGLGGHYEPHFDFARKEETNAFKSLGTGNRIATFIFYMSDVEAGGATVFPEIGATVWPRKGSAAFWHNLYRSGEGDYDTRHAACPVLVGSKWVANKWIHEHGQELARPCALSPDE